ncbi:hypothetical protein BHM03_00034411 [Ensete ventricosum]|nr:hypothetical protein BHM03_00034411 [Ensete ventricosum]
MLDVSRVQKELAECNRDTTISGVSIALHDGGSDLSHLSGTISGPVATPYEGGTFQIDIRLPSTIPFLCSLKNVIFGCIFEAIVWKDSLIAGDYGSFGWHS